MAFLSTQEYRQLRSGPVAGHLPKEIAGLVTGYLVAPGVEALADDLADKMMKVLTNTICTRPCATATEYTQCYRDAMKEHLPNEIIELVFGYSYDYLPDRDIVCALADVPPNAHTNIRAIQESDWPWTDRRISVRISTSPEDLWAFICGDDSIYGPALAHTFAYISGPPYVVTSRVLLDMRDMLRERVQKYRPGL